jgi:phage terminase large subunit GpA-like protein
MLPSGDSETQADSRSRAFLFAKLFKVSTPLVEPGCRITSKNFVAGTQEHVHVPCRSCGLCRRSNGTTCWRRSTRRPGRRAFHLRRLPGPRSTAPTSTGCSTAAWVAHNPGARERSFYLWSAYSRLESWAEIALAWLKVKGNPSAEQVFLNDTVGMAYKSRRRIAAVGGDPRPRRARPATSSASFPTAA